MRRRIIWQVVLHVLLIGLVIYLFSYHGAIDTYLNKDTSFLILPLVGFLIAELAARLVFTASGQSLQGKAIYHLLNGVAWGFLLYCLFDRASSFYSILVNAYPRSSFIVDMKPYIPAVKSLNMPMVVFILGITIYSVASIPEYLQPKWKVKQAGEACGLVVMGFALWGMVQEFRGFWQPLSNIAWIPFAGCMLMALGRISNYGKNSKNGIVSDICSWFLKATVNIIVIAILLGTYLAVVRPEWIDRYRYAPLVDWGIVVCTVGYAYFNAKSGLGIPDASPVVLESWRKHMQQVEIKIGREFEQLAFVQKQFVDEGERGPLLVHLALLLGDNEWHEGRIYSVLQPLINYQDINTPWFSFRWKQRRIKKQNKDNRRKLVNQIVSGLEPEKITRTKIGHRRVR